MLGWAEYQILLINVFKHRVKAVLSSFVSSLPHSKQKGTEMFPMSFYCHLVFQSCNHRHILNLNPASQASGGPWNISGRAAKPDYNLHSLSAESNFQLVVHSSGKILQANTGKDTDKSLDAYPNPYLYRDIYTCTEGVYLLRRSPFI